MIAFLLTLIACFLIETGGRAQQLSAILSDRFGTRLAFIFALVAATLANAIASTVAGHVLHGMMRERPLQLFQALALLFAGAAMLFPSRRFDRLDTWRLGTFATTFLGIFILQFGDSSQFLILATAGRENAIFASAIGGALGIGAAIAMGVSLGEQDLAALPLRPIRTFLAILFLLFGIVQALSATGLIQRSA